MSSIPKETIGMLYDLTGYCAETGRYDQLEIHHRIFRSAWDRGVKRVQDNARQAYELQSGSELGSWGMHDIQNLVLLTREVHQRLHNGDRALRDKYWYSFTHPETGTNTLLGEDLY